MSTGRPKGDLNEFHERTRALLRTLSDTKKAKKPLVSKRRPSSAASTRLNEPVARALQFYSYGLGIGDQQDEKRDVSHRPSKLQIPRTSDQKPESEENIEFWKPRKIILKERPPSNNEKKNNGIFVSENAQSEIPVVYRAAAAKEKSPERIDLNNRELKCMPILESESRLRVLNLQSNIIARMRNLSLRYLVFLDLYNNQIEEISGLEGLPMLRVLMLGKNNIKSLGTRLSTVQHLDVLDLHSNSLENLNGLDNLHALRVLNVSSNCLRGISAAEIADLGSLSELNARRNKIAQVEGVSGLPSLKQLHLSSNQLTQLHAVKDVFACKLLTELSLDGNKGILEAFPSKQEYRVHVSSRCSRNLEMLDSQPLEKLERRDARRIAAAFRRRQSAVEIAHVSRPVTQSEAREERHQELEQEARIDVTSRGTDIIASSVKEWNCPMLKWMHVRPSLENRSHMVKLDLKIELKKRRMVRSQLNRGFYEFQIAAGSKVLHVFGESFSVFEDEEALEGVGMLVLQQVELDDMLIRVFPKIEDSSISKLTLASPLMGSLRELAILASAIPTCIKSVRFKMHTLTSSQFLRPIFVHQLHNEAEDVDGVRISAAERQAANMMLEPLLQSITKTNFEESMLRVRLQTLQKAGELEKAIIATQADRASLEAEFYQVVEQQRS